MSSNDANKLWNLTNEEITNILILAGQKNKTIPKNGWLDTCYFCSTVTSKIKILWYKNKQHYVFRCKECINKVLEYDIDV